MRKKAARKQSMVIDDAWEVDLTRIDFDRTEMKIVGHAAGGQPRQITVKLFTWQFKQIAAQMKKILNRNVQETTEERSAFVRDAEQ